MVSKNDAKHLYDALIDRNRTTQRVKFKTERHHIVPRAHGGSNDSENLVHLTHQDHFLAHYYLWKIHNDRATTYAFHLMFNKRRALDESLLLEYAAEYEVVKEQQKILASSDLKGRPSPMKGKKHSEETKKRMSESRRGELSPSYGRKPSLATIEKIRKGNLGKNIPMKPNKESVMPIEVRNYLKSI